MNGFTWVRHREHGGWWHCPDGVLDDMAAAGWEPADGPPPEQPSSAVAEQLAWRAEQTAAAADTKPTKAARRGKPEQE